MQEHIDEQRFRVDLTAPDVCIFVEINNDFVCFSVLDTPARFKDYHLLKVAGSSSGPVEKVKLTIADEKQEEEFELI